MSRVSKLIRLIGAGTWRSDLGLSTIVKKVRILLLKSFVNSLHVMVAKIVKIDLLAFLLEHVVDASSSLACLSQLLHPPIQKFALFQLLDGRGFAHLVLYYHLANLNHSPVLKLTGWFDKHVMNGHVQQFVGFTAFTHTESVLTLGNQVAFNEIMENLVILPKIPH
jgi:hypothetical protein